MVINWKVTVQMCCFDWEYAFPLGTVEQPGWLREVWQGPAIRNLRKAHAENRYTVNSRCQTCETWGTRDEFDRYVDFNEASYFSVF